MATVAITYPSLKRQVNHWLLAAKRLSNLDHLASSYGWQGVDQNIGLLLRTTLQESVNDLVRGASILKDQINESTSENSVPGIRQKLLVLRDRYLKVEQTIHFYTLALNSRTTPGVAALLRACDALCLKSMQQLLKPLGKIAPPALTYIDKGVGASILKAGLRLWDGKVSPVAGIKITQHNLFRPTAIIHETGHQVAHITSWNEELSSAFSNELARHSPVVADAFASWSSEIAADAFAFVNTGYASVAALHDVLSGWPPSVLAYHRNDPHPISYVRVLMNTEMCRQMYGNGPWDDLQTSFTDTYDLDSQNSSSIGLIKLCVSTLRDVVSILLTRPFRCFGDRSITQIVSPEKVSPRSLEKLDYLAGPALYTSHAWIWNECLSLLALNNYRIAVGTGDMAALYKQQEEWMTKLGFAVELN